MVAEFPTVLQMAIAAERLTVGRINELLIQATMIWKAGTAPRGMRNMAKKRTAVLREAVTRTLPTQETISRRMMWILRSLVRPAVYVVTTETRKAANQTGACAIIMSVHNFFWVNSSTHTVKSNDSMLP